MNNQPIFRVLFINNGKSYEIYTKNVQQGLLYGFIEIEELLFNSHSGLLVDPSEEKLKSEFEGVKRSQIPMHSIIRIDEVEKQGIPKIGDASSNVVTPFPIANLPSKP
ncbi:MAG: hypothetical protein COA86_01705 [Kangiella sp.]|nr:MAG: hypothetical protein COA86_01705 [Kangiella sp.]